MKLQKQMTEPVKALRNNLRITKLNQTKIKQSDSECEQAGHSSWDENERDKHHKHHEVDQQHHHPEFECQKQWE